MRGETSRAESYAPAPCRRCGRNITARELGGLNLPDALSLLLVIAAKEPTRFERAAIR